MYFLPHSLPYLPATSIIHKIKSVISLFINEIKERIIINWAFFEIKIMICTWTINSSHISLLSLSQFPEEKYSLHTLIWAFPCTGWPKVYLGGEGILVIIDEQNHRNILWPSSEITYGSSKLWVLQWPNFIRNSHLLVISSPQNLG